MANSERDYEPAADSLRSFDLSMDMHTVDEPSRLPLLVVIALVVLAAFAGVVWLAYTQGVERGRATVSRELIAREVWKIRRTTSVPAYTGLKIYEQAGAREQGSSVASAPKRTAVTAGNAIPALRPSAGVAPEKPPTVSAKLPTKPATPTLPPPTGAAAPPQATTLQPAKVTAKPQPHMVAVRGPTELSKPAAMPTHPITSLDSPAVPAATRQQADKPAPVAAPAPVPAKLKGVVLQIGSYKSETEARQSWNGFKSAHASAEGYQADVRAADLGAKGRWYRLRMGPFADKESAMEVCRKLKADGANCLLAQ